MADHGLVLVLNAGSSSLKFCVYRTAESDPWPLEARGQIEGIGTAARFTAKDGGGTTLHDERLEGSVRDMPAALDSLAKWLRGRFQGRERSRRRPPRRRTADRRTQRRCSWTRR